MNPHDETVTDQHTPRKKLTQSLLSAYFVGPFKSIPTPNFKAKNSPLKSQRNELRTEKSITPRKSSQKSPPISSGKRNLFREDADETIIVLTPAQNYEADKKGPNYLTVTVFENFFQEVMQSDNLRCLLSEQEVNSLQTLFSSHDSYKYTLIKLFMWLPKWYNLSKYVNEQIGLFLSTNEVRQMYDFLSSNKFVETDHSSEDLGSLLNNLDLKDLRDLHKSFKLKGNGGKKETIVARLVRHCDTQSTLSQSKTTTSVLRERITQKWDLCVKISDQITKTLYKVFLLNTFTSMDFPKPKDYFASLRTKPTFCDSYYMDYESRVFASEVGFTEYTDAMLLRIQIETALEKRTFDKMFATCEVVFEKLMVLNGHCETSDLRFFDRFTAEAQYVSMLTSCAKHLTASYPDSVQVWLEYLIAQNFPHSKHKRGYWYCQLCLIYTKYLKQYEEAAKILITCLETEGNLTEPQLHELAFRGHILERKCYKVPDMYREKIKALVPAVSCDRDFPPRDIVRKSMSNEQGRKRHYVEEALNGDKIVSSVEQTALDFYNKNGYPSGDHYEGSLIGSLFVLLFWDIIYNHPVKGAFISPNQSAPLDLYTEYFYANREAAIVLRLRQISSDWSDDELLDFVSDKWRRFSHVESVYSIGSFVTSVDMLRDFTGSIDRGLLGKICERLARSFKDFKSGFPDLTVWNSVTKQVKFVEVKSENDRLSIKQKLWIGYLMDSGGDVEVCYVNWNKKKGH